MKESVLWLTIEVKLCTGQSKPETRTCTYKIDKLLEYPDIFTC